MTLPVISGPAANLETGWPWLAAWAALGLAGAIVAAIYARIDDRRRIRLHLADQGAVLLSIARTKRIEAALLDENERFYRITYRDNPGWEHRALCKISTWGGIYYADDQVAGQPPASNDAVPDPAARIVELLTENLRLKEELSWRMKTKS